MEQTTNSYIGLLALEPMMPEIAADQSSPSCSHLFPGPGIEQLQSFSPDLFSPRANSDRVAPSASIVIASDSEALLAMTAAI
jgi:hypothetical protein